MNNDLISNFITDVCFVLGIEVPKVTHDFLDICIDTRKEQFTGEKFLFLQPMNRIQSSCSMLHIIYASDGSS